MTERTFLEYDARQEFTKRLAIRIDNLEDHIVEGNPETLHGRLVSLYGKVRGLLQEEQKNRVQEKHQKTQETTEKLRQLKNKSYPGVKKDYAQQYEEYQSSLINYYMTLCDVIHENEMLVPHYKEEEKEGMSFEDALREAGL